ncbi:MAG TPA: RNA-binding cell elongation regulator Jag/EloR [Caproiciproducens sp.]|nr:RNA-binding cell elongation regulator Jag/EloR [Caproiciproducens sp.]
MIKEAIATGDTVELAREAACRELGVETYDAEFEILEMPTKKTFGLFGGNPAKVRVFIESSPAEAAASYLKTILASMGLHSVEISVTEEESGALLSLTGEDIGFIIGHRGETLDALQYLAGLVANHIDNSYYRITLDIGNYREKRKDTLEVLGKKMAAKAVKTGRNTSLEPMNPYERRIIHTAVQTVPGAKSWSEGEDMGRHVVIGPEAGERPMPRRSFNNNGRPQQNRPYNNNGGNGKPRGNFNNNRGPRPAQAPSPAPTAENAAFRQTAHDKSTPLYGRIDSKK